MGIDASIYSQIQQPKFESPMNALAQMSQIKNAQNQNRLADLKFSEAERTLASENSLRDVTRNSLDPVTGKIDATKMRTGLAGLGDYKQLNEFETNQATQVKATREAEKASLEQAIAKQKIVAQYAGAAKDQASWTQGLTELQSMGVDVSKVPQQFDLQTAGTLRDRALTGEQQLTEKWKTISDNRDERKFSYQQTNDADTRRVTVRGQDLSASTARRGQDIGASTAMRGQDMSSATAAAGRSQAESHFQAGQDKGQYDADRGLLINPRTGVGRPVVGSDGVALGGKDKLTEDQGKATGWLVQAENAFKNMKSATENKPSASKPGFPDMVAGVPSFGIGGAVGNMMRGTERQKFMQGSSSLGEALLRAATGAGVNKDEAAQKIRELTPVFGDDDATIQQKMDAIPLYIDSLKVRAGPGAGKAAAIAAKAKTPNINDLLKKYGD